ncbi:MAG: hypothetical protein IPM21_12335 [Acidobacteria bacterium]|nr:hypothetical protein [Acidobacteriota bacterium]
MEFELPKDFKELFELLNTNSVRYLLIGGYAVGIHGYTRATNDLDIFVADDEQNTQNLRRSLISFGFGEASLGDDIFPDKRCIIEMGVEPMKIQIMNFADGIEFETAYANRIETDVEDIAISTIDKPDLIKNKITSGRLKDLADVERLEKM